MRPGPVGIRNGVAGPRLYRWTKRSSSQASPVQDLIALDDALNALAAFDLRKSQVVEMRFFGGLSVEETAEALHVSADTVMRDWRLAKVWLVRELRGEQLEGG